MAQNSHTGVYRQYKRQNEEFTTLKGYYFFNHFLETLKAQHLSSELQVIYLGIKLSVMLNNLRTDIRVLDGKVTQTSLSVINEWKSTTL